MDKRTVIHNGKVILPDSIIDNGYVIFNGKQIVNVGTGTPPKQDGDTIIDAEGKYISPGFIDIHIHGGGGHDFMDATVEAYLGAAECHAKFGTTGLTPTTMTCSNEELFDAFDAYEKALPQNTKGAKFLGLHLEGPYFPESRKGAQDAKYLKVATKDDVNEILSKSKHIVRWSAAPELPGALELADELKKRGIMTAVAHTDATAAEVIEGHKHGFDLMTHFYNAMIGIHTKNNLKTAGVIEAAYLIEDMRVELIADGIHVPVELLRYAYNFKGSDRMCLITDAMRGAGMPNGIYKLGSLEKGQDIRVVDGTARMVDGDALGGSVATTNRLIKVMHSKVGVSLEETVKMASLTPARFLKIEKTKGSLEVGKDADIILFDTNYDVHRTIVEGNEVYVR